MSEEFTVTQATVEDWPDIKAILARLKSSRFSQYVNSSLEEAEGMLINSKIWDSCGLLLLKWDGLVCGIAAMLSIDAPKPGVAGGASQRHAFVHNVYIDPATPTNDGIRRVPSKAGKVMCDGMEEWAKKRGAVYIFGNVRMDGNLGGFYRKFGWKAEHYVVGKVFENGQ